MRQRHNSKLKKEIEQRREEREKQPQQIKGTVAQCIIFKTIVLYLHTYKLKSKKGI